MKKILAMVLAMMLVLSMSAAFADTTTGNTVNQEVKFDKTLVNADNVSDSANNDEVTFTFTAENTQKPTDATSAPALTIDSVTFADNKSADGETKEVKIYTYVDADDSTKNAFRASDFPVLGKYVYKITEAVSTEAGINWTNGAYETDGKVFYFVVTIVRNTASNAGAYDYIAVFHFTDDLTSTSNKTTGITNTYSAGNLTVSKEVTGNMADYDHYFPIVVTLTAPANKTVDWTQVGINSDELTASGTLYDETTSFTQPTSVTAGENTFYLKHSQTVELTNLPYGVTYEVTEAKPTLYQDPSVTYNDADKTINTATSDVDVLNKKEGEVDTGIALDNAPYMILMALVVIAGAALIVKRASANR